MKRLKLPIGIQSFQKIRTEGYAYVDKTRFIASLVNNGTYYFLSRPRRFGKSLLLDTIDHAFSGKREYFSDLYLHTPEAGWDFLQIFPVVRISLGQRINRNATELCEYLTHILAGEAGRYNVHHDRSLSPGFQLDLLIKNLYRKYQMPVVVLIDEYDKPILDAIEDTETIRIMRDELKSFYGILKDLDPYLKFVFLTGVSKFSKTGIFSGLNNLDDITLDPRYSDICGYTQYDLEHVFVDYLTDFSPNDIKDWYNGYSWSGQTVYNPFDILMLFSKKMYRSYWFETGTPSFLIRLWQKNLRFPGDFDNLIAGEDLLSSFDVDNIRVETLLFQAGYLTIKEWTSDPVRGFQCTLGYPNIEVKTSLNLLFCQSLSGFPVSEMRNRLFEILDSEKGEGLSELLHSFFASIPFEWYRKNHLSSFEGYYASIMYTFFASLGYRVVAEDTTNLGRIDLTVITSRTVWIFEFKVKTKGVTGNIHPLEQIRKKGYSDKYHAKGLKIREIGIIFDPDTRNITEWEQNWNDSLE